MKSLVAFVAVLGSLTWGQVPRPYLSGSVNLMPAGYGPLAFGVGGGLMYDAHHFVFDSFVGYDNGHKENDATSANNKGHDRFVRGLAAYRFGSSYIGAGARWSQLSTTNYTKGGAIFDAGSWHPELGVGRDFGIIARGQALWMFHPSKEVTHYPDGTSCDGCGNGSQGVDISFWIPSPINPKHRHWFVRYNVLLYRFHDTITDPNNIELTKIQTSRKHFTDSTEIMVMYRF